MKEKLRIIPFKKQHTKEFHDLNIAWLEKYFYVEDHDREVLENPQSYIIDNGGFIFMVEYQNEFVGTVALINEKEGFELSKMAVDPKYQGLKFGQQLMSYCINFAKEKKWKKLLLYSNRSLENAIYIYRKFGFIEVPVVGSPYSRGDIKMILDLKSHKKSERV
ncbi:MAG: GNAT family N-acetyltransferase [Urechidicola sp.]|nr:GNAT family N-acetyltransferase [Urechidicola sp.]